MQMHLNPIFFLALIVTLGACSKTQQQGEKETLSNTPEAGPEKFTLKRDTLEARVTIPGELIAYQQVDLYAKVSGFVKELKVDIGSKVKAGAVLMTLEAPELTAQLSAAEYGLKSQEALVMASQANYNRLVETSKTPGTISPSDLEQAEAKRSTDRANLEAARARYNESVDTKNYLVIRAPFDGTITARNVSTGAYVGPSGKGSELPVLTLQQQDKLRLVISIAEGYSGYFKPGDEVTFKVRSIASQNFTAKLARLSGALDQRLRAQRAEADIDNRSGNLLAGTVAEVIIFLRSADNSFVVPKTAVVNSAEGVFVVKVIDGKANRIPVSKGIEANNYIEVFGELSERDTLLMKATDEIKEGSEVR